MDVKDLFEFLKERINEANDRIDEASKTDDRENRLRAYGALGAYTIVIEYIAKFGKNK
jgi:hypothetical protein